MCVCIKIQDQKPMFQCLLLPQQIREGFWRICCRERPWQLLTPWNLTMPDDGSSSKRLEEESRPIRDMPKASFLFVPPEYWLAILWLVSSASKSDRVTLFTAELSLKDAKPWASRHTELLIAWSRNNYWIESWDVNMRMYTMIYLRHRRPRRKITVSFGVTIIDSETKGAQYWYFNELVGVAPRLSAMSCWCRPCPSSHILVQLMQRAQGSLSDSPWKHLLDEDAPLQSDEH